jgi:hypothetical protein
MIVLHSYPISFNYLLIASLHSGSGAHPASCQMGIGILSPGVKQPGREANRSPPSGSEVKRSGSIPPLSLLGGVVVSVLATAPKV